MFSQLPEATRLFAIGSLFSLLSPLPLIVSQQFFVFRLMLGGGLGKLRGLSLSLSLSLKVLCFLLSFLSLSHPPLSSLLPPLRIKVVRPIGNVVSLLDYPFAKPSLLSLSLSPHPLPSVRSHSHLGCGRASLSSSTDAESAVKVADVCDVLRTACGYQQHR